MANARHLLIGALAFVLVACGSNSSSSGSNPSATLSPGNYQSTINSNCGTRTDKIEGDSEVTVDGTQVTVRLPLIGSVGPATLNEGRIEIPAFSFPIDGGTASVNPLTLNLTADDRLSGNFTLSWSDGVDSCSGSGNMLIRR